MDLEGDEALPRPKPVEEQGSSTTLDKGRVAYFIFLPPWDGVPLALERIHHRHGLLRVSSTLRSMLTRSSHRLHDP